MVKILRQKNTKPLCVLWMSALLTLLSLTACFFYPYTNLNSVLHRLSSISSLLSNRQAFYGENIDMSQILPTSQHYVVNNKGQDLIDIAADLGINLIRITNARRSFKNDADSVYTRGQWNQVLNKMQNKGIQALILIETDSNNGDYYTPDIRPIYLHLVQAYLDSGVFSNPDVYAVDIKNEPLLTNANIRILQAAHKMIKGRYPDLKQTIGWWATPKSPTDPYTPDNYNWSDFSAGQKIATIVDFYSIHMYGLATDTFEVHLGPDLKTKVFLAQVEHGLQTKKPILIEEFGEANGDAVSDQDTIGNPQLQANSYQGVYQALEEMHDSQILGTVAFDFYSRNQYPDAWAIVKNNGDYLFPAAYILQQYASGTNYFSFQAPTIVTSQSYLVKNSDNHTIKNLRISDRLGLKLQLDATKNYAVSLSANGVLLPIEVLYYNNNSNAYEAVYQGIKKGSVQLNIIPEANCKRGSTCPAPVYTLGINVQ